MQADVNTDERVKLLIQKASATIGGQNAVARTMGYTSAEVSAWAHGLRPCPAKAQAVLAHLAGLNGPEMALFAMIENERNPKRKAALIEAVGKAYRRITEVASFAIFGSAALASDAGSYLIRCIERLNARTLYRSAHLSHRFIPN